jgi:hypothetical protein
MRTFVFIINSFVALSVLHTWGEVSQVPPLPRSQEKLIEMGVKGYCLLPRNCRVHTKLHTISELIFFHPHYFCDAEDFINQKGKRAVGKELPIPFVLKFARYIQGPPVPQVPVPRKQ